MNKVVRFLMIGIGIFFIFSCVESEKKTGFLPNQSEVSYAYTHGGYVGQVVATTNSSGKLNVEIDEAFLPHTLCIVDIESDEWDDGNTVNYLERGKAIHVAKNIEYNGKKFIGVIVGNGYVYIDADEKGMAIGTTSLEKQILRNQDSMAAYYDNIQKGKLIIYDKFGGTAKAVTTSSYGGLTKRNASGYWNFGLTWPGNIKAVKDFVETKGHQFSLKEMVLPTEENDDGFKFWSVADAVTGASLTDFKDYFVVAQSAIAQLKTY